MIYGRRQSDRRVAMGTLAAPHTTRRHAILAGYSDLRADGDRAGARDRRRRLQRLGAGAPAVWVELLERPGVEPSRHHTIARDLRGLAGSLWHAHIVGHRGRAGRADRRRHRYLFGGALPAAAAPPAIVFGRAPGGDSECDLWAVGRPSLCALLPRRGGHTAFRD